MIINLEERESDSPFVEAVMHGYTAVPGSTIRPAESHWHMVFVKVNGRVYPIVAGPLTTAGVASWGEGAEILWVKFKLGTFMPHLPTRKLLDAETNLPGASHNAFWLNSSTWQLPDYNNVETFVDWLVRDELLVSDPVVNTVLRDRAPDVSSRTVRHRFLQSTGLSHNYIRQMKRAQQAAALLEQGVPILDTVYELGYYDQPHLTRSLKQFIGYTPSQIAHLSRFG
jgi:AraC-like DNA-binding protein